MDQYVESEEGPDNVAAVEGDVRDIPQEDDEGGFHEEAALEIPESEFADDRDSSPTAEASMATASDAAADPAPAREPQAIAEPLPTPQELEEILEALIFTARTPVAAARLGAAVGIPKEAVEAALVNLNARYARERRGFTLENIAGGWQMLSNPRYAEYVERFHAKESDGKLSAAALETLAVVAYRQPVMRADVEAIRGVQVGAILRSLLEKDLIRISGRADALGRPLLYGTTQRFLDHFGLASLKELPSIRELQEP